MNKQTQKELLSIVKQNYSEIAEHYGETRKKKLWPELVELTEEVQAGNRILDVGCGSGKLLQNLEEKDIFYLGVDASKELVKVAQKEWGENEKRKFKVGDILNLGEIKEIDFDQVFCIAVLQHIPSKEFQIQALRNLKNKVKPEGRIVISVWNMWSKAWQKKKFRTLIFKFLLLKIIGKNKMDFGDILFDWKNSEGQVVSQRYYHAFNKFELKKIVKKASLKIEKFYKDEYNYYLVLKK